MNLTKILGVVAITFICITSAFAQKKQLNVGEEFPVAGQGSNQTIVSQNGQYALSKDYSAGNDGRFYTHLVSNPNQKIVEFGAPHYSNTRLKINNGWLNMVGINPKTNSEPNSVLFIYSNGNGQNTNGGGVKLIVENDGSLSLYSAAGAKVWSKTSPN
ncbi:MAG: hypothetical protein KDC72_09030, partial [Bacteroidetes bacterium]|nr:hypothetical protein [Bacteroidota bacterium]